MGTGPRLQNWDFTHYPPMRNWDCHVGRVREKRPSRATCRRRVSQARDFTSHYFLLYPFYIQERSRREQLGGMRDYGGMFPTIKSGKGEHGNKLHPSC
jgi:hypothetical protein